jgi:hypothetical protein
VFILARELHPLLKDADPEKRLDGNHLNEIAEALGSAPKEAWQMFRLNVLFKALDAP